MAVQKVHLKSNLKGKGIGYWKPHIEGWESSGISQKAYCREQQISYPGFTYWKRRLLKNKDLNQNRNDFKKVHVIPEKPDPRETKVEIKKPALAEISIGHLMIKVPAGFDLNYLKELIEGVQKC